MWNGFSVITYWNNKLLFSAEKPQTIKKEIFPAARSYERFPFYLIPKAVICYESLSGAPGPNGIPRKNQTRSCIVIKQKNAMV